METVEYEKEVKGELLDEEFIYVYGVVNKETNISGINGLKDKSIKKFNFKDVAALITPYPNLNPLLREEEALQHAEILKGIANKTTVIPMSFGMVFKDEEFLKIVLSKSYLALKETLMLIEGKIELGVKIVSNQAYEMRDGVSQEILEALNKISVKSIKGGNFSDRLLLNSSFLVERNNFSRFSKEIAKLEKKHKDLRFIYTGPWPPFSFININIRGGS